MKLFLPLAMIASLALTGCISPGVHQAIKMQFGGVNMSPQTGVSAGYGGATLDLSQDVDKNGKAIIAQDCSGKSTTPATYSNMNSKANAQAQSIAPTASVGSVTGPQIAWASGDTTANGGPAVIAAAMATPKPADTIAAYCGNTVLPSAVSGSIVRDGVAPKQ